MKQNSRLSDALHVLLHMAEDQSPVTSEVLAEAMHTHPVVIRRTMAGLRERGYVRSSKGHNGGWVLTCDLSQVTLLDIYIALDRPPLLAIGQRTMPHGCLVEEAVNAALNHALHEAQELLLSRLGEVTLNLLSADLQTRLKKRGGSHSSVKKASADIESRGVAS